MDAAGTGDKVCPSEGEETTVPPCWPPHLCAGYLNMSSFLSKTSVGMAGTWARPPAPVLSFSGTCPAICFTLPFLFHSPSLVLLINCSLILTWNVTAPKQCLIFNSKMVKKEKAVGPQRIYLSGGRISGFGTRILSIWNSNSGPFHFGFPVFWLLFLLKCSNHSNILTWIPSMINNVPVTGHFHFL